MTVRVAFRVDASQAIGTGHWRRCRSLAQALAAEGAQSLFVSRPHDAVAGSLARDGQRCVWLSPSHGLQPQAAGDPPHAAWAGARWVDDANETARALADFAPDWLVVDHYAFDGRWHQLAAGLMRARVAVIDDLADRPIHASLLIDQNLHADHRAKYAGRADSRVRLLGGPKYAMLAPPYADAKPLVFREEVASIGIFMGGTDPADVTSQALRACREVAGFEGRIEVVSSLSSPHHAARLRLAAQWPDTDVLADLPDLCDFFSRHDLQVGSGGGAAWERCCLAVPTVACPIAANQDAVLPPLAALGALHLVDRTGETEGGIADGVSSLLKEPRRRREMGKRARALVDGSGSARVAAVLSLAVNRVLSVREAVEADEGLLLRWANDPDVRRNSFSGDAISPEAHASWFRRKLADRQGTLMTIAMSGAGTPAGQVRFDRTPHGWELDYSLDISLRGLSLARPMLMQGITMLARKHGPVRITALVKPGNAASARAFEALGFARTGVDRHGLICHSFELDHTGNS